MGDSIHVKTHLPCEKTAGRNSSTRINPIYLFYVLGFPQQSVCAALSSIRKQIDWNIGITWNNQRRLKVSNICKFTGGAPPYTDLHSIHILPSLALSLARLLSSRPPVVTVPGGPSRARGQRGGATHQADEPPASDLFLIAPDSTGVSW